MCRTNVAAARRDASTPAFEDVPMTWSIVARDPATGAFGVAVATKFFAVGALTPHADGGVGALATQALINPLYGPRGLRLLREGVPAADVVQILTVADAGQAHRQIHVQDAQGRIAVHTGAACIGWCGHVVGDGFSVAGNMLTGARVVADTATAYAQASALPFARRLIQALEAGEAAGGDIRGRQSAALLIHTSEEYPALSLRVDDHADPLAEMKRLEAVSRERFVPFATCLPTRADPAGLTDRAGIEAQIAAALAGQT
jgi:uncharacterized Ntn-hydrolase superfamily protein